MAFATSTATEARLRFGVFEVDFDQWQLRKSGARVKLQRKPFQILRALLERRGDLVTRAELARLLWPDLHVEYEQSLNTAINCLRQVLGDTPRSCRYIETCPGLGYRFVAHVESLGRLDIAVATSVPAGTKTPAEADYLRGRFFFDKMTSENLARARAYFESALRADAGFAPAHAGLAEIQTLLAEWGVVSTPIAGEETLRFAQRALSADANSAEAHVALANAYRLLGRPWAVVYAQYGQALSLDRNCFSAHLWLASLLSASARHSEAARHLDAAQRINSLSLLLHYRMAWASYTRRAYRETTEHCWNALMLDPGFAPAQYTLGLAYEQLGMLDDAITEFGNARCCSNGHPATLASLAHALSTAGLEREEILTELENSNPSGYRSRYWTALAWTGNNDGEAALTALEEASLAGDCLMDWLGVEPRFDPLRASSQFQKWLRFL